MHAGTTARSPRATIEVAVLIAGAAQSLYKRADGALFVAGIPGQPYALRVRNLTGGRIEVITSVDGRNALKDERADQFANGGLVVPARGFYDFTGFRLDDGAVREFVFGSPGRLERTVAVQAAGSTANVGVLGFAAYRERGYRPYSGSLNYIGAPVAAASAGPAGGAAAASAIAAMEDDDSFGPATRDSAPVSRSIGTEMGALREDRVGRTSFTRDGEPDILAIGYDTEDTLRALGIIGPPEPNPFPGIGTGYGKYTQPA